MATVTKPDRSLIAALGPFKIEVVQLTSVLNDETYQSKLASPTFALAFPAADAGATTQNMSATVSGRTVTIRDPATTAVTLVIFGDGLA